MEEKKRFYCMVHQGYIDDAINVHPVYLTKYKKHAFVCGACAKTHYTDGKPTTFLQMEGHLEKIIDESPELSQHIEDPIIFGEELKKYRSAKEAEKENFHLAVRSAMVYEAVKAVIDESDNKKFLKPKGKKKNMGLKDNVYPFIHCFK